MHYFVTMAHLQGDSQEHVHRTSLVPLLSGEWIKGLRKPLAINLWLKTETKKNCPYSDGQGVFSIFFSLFFFSFFFCFLAVKLRLELRALSLLAKWQAPSPFAFSLFFRKVLRYCLGQTQTTILLPPPPEQLGCQAVLPHPAPGYVSKFKLLIYFFHQSSVHLISWVTT
jgi:hypothetical protein